MGLLGGVGALRDSINMGGGAQGVRSDFNHSGAGFAQPLS